MKKRGALSSAFIAVFAASTLILCQAAPASAALQYGASTYVQSGITSAESGGWGYSSAGGTLGGASATSGFYATSPLVSATANSSLNYAKAIAGVDDWLVFSGTEGTYGDVTFHIAGNWSIGYDLSTQTPWEAPWVRFSVNFTQQGLPLDLTYDSWRSLRSGSIHESGQLPGTAVWQDFANDTGSLAYGTYSFDFTTRVYYGYAYHFGLAVIAEAPYTPAGHTAFIDDPLTIDVPDGVAFTSLSGSEYTGASAVPVPPSLLLLAPALIGLCVARRKSGR